MKANYDESIISISNTILKHFGLSTYHKSLAELDKILVSKEYDNIILYLCDGLGEKILQDHSAEDSFLRRHHLRTLSSVFPPTTTAATTSIQTGLSTYEHNWLGWDLYIKALDQTVTLFQNRTKNTHMIAADYHAGSHYFPLRTLMDRIREETEAESYGISPFHEIHYDFAQPDQSNEIIQAICKKPGKKFLYVYYDQPDALLHEFGTQSPLVKQVISTIDKRIHNLTQNLENSLLIVTADHGHKDVEYRYLEDYPAIQSLLLRETSIEARAVNFFVKAGCHDDFTALFNQYFGDSFDLLPRQEVLDSKLFGDGTAHPEFENSLGDYLALAHGSLALADTRFDYIMRSHHAGITEDEMIVPLIVIDTDCIKKSEKNPD